MINRLRLLCFTILLLLGSSVWSIDWQIRKYGDIKVWSAPKDSAYANLVVRRLHSRISEFQMRLGVYPGQVLEIKILPNRKEYSRITSGKGKIVQNSEAFYSPHERIIYVRSPDQLSDQVYSDVLMHEYIHWFLDETLENAPLWFHEGMAMYYSGQFGFQAYYNFSRYRFMGYKLSLNDMIYGYPVDKSYWDMFYLTSVFAVNYLDSRHNTEWQNFWNLVGFYYNRNTDSATTKVDFIRAFNVSFRMSLYAFSREYDKTLRKYSWQFPFIGINAIIFSLLPIIIIIAWRKGRRKLQAMPDVILEDEEPEEDMPEDNPEPEDDKPHT